MKRKLLRLLFIMILTENRTALLTLLNMLSGVHLLKILLQLLKNIRFFSESLPGVLSTISVSLSRSSIRREVQHGDSLILPVWQKTARSSMPPNGAEKGKKIFSISCPTGTGRRGSVFRCMCSPPALKWSFFSTANLSADVKKSW